MSAARQAFVSAGSNLGDRCATLAGAISALRDSGGFAALEISTVYETAPVGGVAQPNFLNLAVGLETSLAPEEMLARLLEVESRFGRTRDVRWGPRTLDLDLLSYENEARDTPALQLPHPRMFERAFVTVPLGELLTRTRFQRPCWRALRERLALAPPSDGVRAFASLLAR